MYRFLFRPKWIGFHLLVLAGFVVLMSLGFWQLRRLDQRQEFNADVRRNGTAAVVALDDLLPPGATVDTNVEHELEWRHVSASGTYLGDQELLVDQRSQDGVAGQVVLTPLQLDDGRVLLVERGFVPLGMSNTAPEIAPPPSGEVEVTGRLRGSESRRAGGLTDANPEDTFIPRVDIPLLAERLDAEPVPMFVELSESSPAEVGPYPERLNEPELSDGPHLSYAIQWFIFSICVLIGWVLAVRHSASTRRKAAAKAAKATSAASMEPTDGAATPDVEPAPN